MTVQMLFEGPRQPVSVTVDEKAGIAYIKIRFGTVDHTVEHAPGVYLDVDAEGVLIGIEAMIPASFEGIADAAEKYLRRSDNSTTEENRAVKLAAKYLAVA